jgi:microcompartment protein CcmK/EutM
MILVRVLGPVVATIKDEPLKGSKLMLAEPVGLDGAAIGPPLVCVDRVDAGVGDLALVNKEGSSARALLDDPESPVQAVIVAVVDDVSIAEEFA